MGKIFLLTFLFIGLADLPGLVIYGKFPQDSAHHCPTSPHFERDCPRSKRMFLFLPYCTTEKLSCSVAVELLPTHTSKSEDSATHPFFAALQ